MVVKDTRYDVIVIGGGSGGLRMARRAAALGQRVAVIERARLGGTCVNVGCVPKKVVWNATILNYALHLAPEYAFDITHNGFDWSTFKAKRDAFIKRLNGIYRANLEGDGIDIIHGSAHFCDAHSVQVGEQILHADHFVIAVGGKPLMPEIEGIEHAINSDGFFELESLPKSTLVIGAGYIAVELAGALAALGSKVTLAVRRDGVLRSFDTVVRERIDIAIDHLGIDYKRHTSVGSLHRQGEKIVACDNNGEELGAFEQVVVAIGRLPVTHDLALDAAGVIHDTSGYIEIDEHHNTNVPGIYAVGDACTLNGEPTAQLTPVAIKAAQILAERLFAGSDEVMDYENIPTVVFSHPPIGTIGLTLEEAEAQYPGKITAYKSSFNDLRYGIVAPELKEKTVIHLICEGKKQRIVGLHIVGEGADEMLQGFAVAIKMGATYQDFTNTIAIHPTAAEEVVTLK